MTTEPDDEEVVRTAASAAEDVIFARYDRSEVRDFDVTVQFEAEQLDLDVYLDAAGDADETRRVAKDAVLAARNAVDDLLSG